MSTTKLVGPKSAQCSFTATKTGGYKLTVRAQAGKTQADENLVEVRRNGTVTRYQANRLYSGGAECGTNVIQPGDVVTVTVRQSDEGYRDVDLGAGEGYSC